MTPVRVLQRHKVRRFVSEKGWIASCACGWSTTRRSREGRDADVYEHELEVTVNG